MKLSIDSMKSLELTKMEQLNIIAKGGGLGAPDTDGEEDCIPSGPLNPSEGTQEKKFLKGIKYCIDIPPLPPVVKF